MSDTEVTGERIEEDRVSEVASSCRSPSETEWKSVKQDLRLCSKKKYSLFKKKTSSDNVLAYELASRQLRVKKEMTVVRAELEAYEAENNPDVIFRRPTKITRSVKVNDSYSADSPVSRWFQQQAIAKSSPPVSAVPNVQPAVPSSAIDSIIKQSQMPKLEMKVFNGDPLDFQQWFVSFENLIEDLTDDPVRRLHYLSQYTSGEVTS